MTETPDREPSVGEDSTPSTPPRPDPAAPHDPPPRAPGVSEGSASPSDDAPPTHDPPPRAPGVSEGSASPSDDAPPTRDPSPAPRDPPPSPASSAGDRLPTLLAAGVAALVLAALAFGVGRWTAPDEPSGGAAPAADEERLWTCSMHPQIQLPEPGPCPICGMDLIPLEGGGDDLGPRELRLTQGAAALADLETAPVRRRQVARELRLVGKVDYDETRLDYITAWISGRLDRLFVDFTGTLVRKGDHLVEIYSPELISAQEELLQALEARRRLDEGGSSLLRQTARATVDSTQAKLRNLGLEPAQIAAIESSGRPSDHVTIHAPKGGVIVHKHKNEGDYVQTGSRIYTIADLSQVWVKLDAYESDLPWIRYGQDVSFEADAWPGERFAGRIVFVDPVLTGDTRTVKVRLNVENPDRRLKPGMFVRAVVEAPLRADGAVVDPSLAGQHVCPMHWEVIREEPGVCPLCGMDLVPAEELHLLPDPTGPVARPLVVPASAVLWTGVRSLVYVRLPGPDPVFQGREVVLGPRAGPWFVVRDGVEEGEEVVVAGAFKIDSALQIEARPSMMLPPDELGADRLAAPDAFLTGLEPLWTAYLDAQTALAGDDPGAARAALEALAAAAGDVDWSGLEGEAEAAWLRLRKELRDAASTAAAAGDVEAVRDAFVAVSDAALDLEEAFGHAEGTLRSAFCPMAADDEGAIWLQRGEEIVNPYMGARMLRCGSLRDAFPPRGAASPGGGGATSRPASRPADDEGGR